MGDKQRRPMVTEVHDRLHAAVHDAPLLTKREENGIYVKNREMSRARSMAQENGGYSFDKTDRADLTPHILSNNPISRLKRLAHRHRHDFHYLRRIQWEIIESYLQPGPGEYILDVACGDGYYSRKMAARGARVAAIDLEPARIRNAKTYHNVPGVQYNLANAECLPFPDHTFDKVVSVCALEHFNNPQAAINEMRRVLKPGGTLVLHVDSFSYREISPELREHHRVNYYVENFFRIDSLGKLLNNASFSVDQYKYAFNSPLTHRLFKWGEMRGFTGLPFLLMFPVGYTICKMSDKLMGKHEEGYDLYTLSTALE
jgi:ubiquinone/menaquinone biosynthesis C-methylase UbiE